MDSEHRHELKTNELADLLTHFPQFLKRNANTIIGISLIVIALVTWPMFTKMSRQKTIVEESQLSNSIQMLGQDVATALQDYKSNPEQLNTSLNSLLANAEGLLEQTSETDNPNLAALAYIKAAQAIRTELHLRKDVVSAETIETQTQKAQDAYEKAVEKAEMPTLKAMAQFGIGLCTEERGQTEQAGDIYKAIIDDEAFAPTVFPKLAQQRLDGLQENAEAVTFAPPVQAEEIAPATPAVTDEPTETQTPQTETPAAETNSEE